ncbi:MAG: tetratricopeptide repeat protein [Planctomycetota bacterium]
MNEETIFADALEIEDRDRRDAFVEEACAGDTALKESIQELLRLSDTDGDFLNTPAIGTIEPIDDLQPGTVIGRYRLIDRIGEGGFGEVWRAQQSESVKRIVALKIIKPGMDTRQVIARFEAERQTLAMMSHRNIAAVLDAGSTERGRPYFVMEYVDGSPVDEFCNENRLSIPERLQLFIQICRAVHHAHQKGIVHRDIKPSNIIVATSDIGADARVIDFGIAKAMTLPGDSQVSVTNPRQLMGTPEYMSPEQMAGDPDIDTRTDVYSLGGVLYKLLVGVAPLDTQALRRVGFDELVRAIREDDAPRPSSRILTLEQADSIAEMRATKPKSLSHYLKGELDWIVTRTLEKERARRYGSANDLGKDVERFLAREPVLAGPPSLWYRWKKFVHRNTLGVSAAVIVTIALVVIAGLATVNYFQLQSERDRTYKQWVRAEREKKEAEDQRILADAQRLRAEDQTRNALQLVQMFDDLIREANPERGNPADQDFRKPFDQLAERLSEQLQGQPVTEAQFRQTIGQVYKALREWNKAGVHLKRALELRQETLGKDHADTVESLVEWGEWLYAQSRVQEAEDVILAALTILRNREPDGAIVSALDVLRKIRRLQGQAKESRSLLDEAWEMSRQVHGEDHPRTIRFQGSLAMFMLRQRNWDEAERLARDSLDRMQAALPDSHIGVAMAKHFLSRVLLQVDQLDEAEQLARDSMEIHRRILGKDNIVVVVDLITLARIVRADGRDEEAMGIARQAVETAESGSEEAESGRIQAYELLSNMLRQTDPDESVNVTLKALAARNSIAPSHPALLGDLRQTAVQLRRMERWSEAEDCYRQALQWISVNAPDSAPFRQTTYDLADLLREAGNSEMAIETLKEITDPFDSPLPIGIVELMELFLQNDHRDEATTLAKSLEGFGSDKTFLFAVAGVTQAQLMLQESKPEAAKAKLRQVLEGLHSESTNGRLEERVWHLVVDCEIAQGNFASAERMLLRSFQRTRGRGYFPVDRRRSVLKLVQLYEEWNKPDDADLWREKLKTASR